MNRRVWIEGLLFVAISLVTLADSLRMIFYKRPQVVYDLVGPGSYLLLVSIGLLVAGVIHIYHHGGREQHAAKEETSKEMRFRLIGSFCAFALYLILIDVIGYAIGTFVFLMIMFRIVRIKSWPFNVGLSLSLTLVYYFVFVRYCNIAFPHGILF